MLQYWRDGDDNARLTWHSNPSFVYEFIPDSSARTRGPSAFSRPARNYSFRVSTVRTFRAS